MSALNLPQFKDADKAREYLESQRWPNGPICPHCGSISKEHYALTGKSTRPGLWKCRDCREPFTVTVKTVFERSKIPLNVWLQAVYFVCSSKKGMSAHQLHRTLGVTYKTAWFMAHRIREAMRSGALGPLGGSGKVVEADETYYGSKKGAFRHPQGMEHKQKIFALVERKGQVRAFHVASVTGANLKPILREHVKRETAIYTDEFGAYSKLDREFAAHETVAHTRGEYARGPVHTNTIEGYFSILKRGIIGTYHHVSETHLQRYVTEFDFRYNNRTALGVNDAQRANAVLKEIGGKRLTYRRTTSSEQA